MYKCNSDCTVGSVNSKSGRNGKSVHWRRSVHYIWRLLPRAWDRMRDLTRLADVILLIIRMTKQNKNNTKLLYPSSVSQSKNIKSDRYSTLGLNDEDTSNSYFKIISSSLSTISKANIDYPCKQGHGLTFQKEQLAHTDSCTATKQGAHPQAHSQGTLWLSSGLLELYHILLGKLFVFVCVSFHITDVYNRISCIYNPLLLKWHTFKHLWLHGHFQFAKWGSLNVKHCLLGTVLKTKDG